MATYYLETPETMQPQDMFFLELADDESAAQSAALMVDQTQRAVTAWRLGATPKDDTNLCTISPDGPIKQRPKADHIYPAAYVFRTINGADPPGLRYHIFATLEQATIQAIAYRRLWKCALEMSHLRTNPRQDLRILSIAYDPHAKLRTE